MLLMRRNILNWKHGILFLAYFTAFIAIEVWKIA
jgi:hypothetical protein